MNDNRNERREPRGTNDNDRAPTAEEYCLVLAVPGRDLAYLYQGTDLERYSATIRTAVKVRAPVGSALRSHETAPGKGSTSTYLSDGFRWVKAAACRLCAGATFPADVEGDGACRLCHTAGHAPPQQPVTAETAKLRAKHNAGAFDDARTVDADNVPRTRLAWERRAS